MMLDDILTVMWKERRALFRYQGRRSQAVMVVLSPVMLAIYLPWDAGVVWVERPVSLLIAAIVPVLLVGITIPDSFAGERERHTLGTLLASRLPDRAILFGKVALAVALGWGVTMFVLLLSLVTVNVVHGHGELLLYTPTVALADVIVSFLLAVLTAGAGVLISLRSATVQEAQQILMGVLMFPPTLLGPIVLLIASARPEWGPKALLANVDATLLAAMILAALVLIDLGLLAGAMARFQRPRLILA
jgi:ABC-2 type transport system permease protein